MMNQVIPYQSEVVDSARQQNHIVILYVCVICDFVCICIIFANESVKHSVGSEG